MARDDFEDADQLQIGNDGIFMLTCFSKCFQKRRVQKQFVHSHVTLSPSLQARLSKHKLSMNVTNQIKKKGEKSDEGHVKFVFLFLFFLIGINNSI